MSLSQWILFCLIVAHPGGTVLYDIACVHRTENSLPIPEVCRGQGLGWAAKTSLDFFRPLRTVSYIPSQYIVRYLQRERCF